ncbi:MAG: tRNA (guanosine(46)-N7)-methyltransferase TrmB [Bacilli bacterium]
MRIRGRDKVPALLEMAAPFLVDAEQDMVLPAGWLNGYERLCLEVGCGRGSFICQMTEREPDTLFVGLEKFLEIIARAASLAALQGLRNARFIRADAAQAEFILPLRAFHVIYLNFSDPWPRRRNDIKRLTHPRYLQIYRNLLTAGGRLEFKTDNAAFFDWSSGSLQKAGWNVLAIDQNVSDSAPPGEEMTAKYTQTEYEQRFRAQGTPIRHLRAVPIPLPGAGVSAR